MSTTDDQSQMDGSPDPPPGDGAPGASEYGPPREDEVSLLDLLLVLARNKTLIVRTVLVFTLLGVTYALLAPEEFTSEARVVREAQQEGPNLGNIGGVAALQGLGVNLGGAQSGLTPEAFPDVLKGRRVRLSVVRDTFSFSDAERPMTFVGYVNQPPSAFGLVLKYTLKLPWTIKNELFERGTVHKSADTQKALFPAEEEAKAMEKIKGMVNARVDQQSGMMTIGVTAQNPRLAASLTQSFIEHLTTRVRRIRTEKVRERLQFVEQRFQEAEKELEAAEERLAQFLERNQNPTTASLQFRRDRLQRQVSFKEQLYSEFQSQLTQTRLDLQRRQPVVTVVEEPVPPVEPSAPNRLLITVLSLFLGAFVGVGGAFVAAFFSMDKSDPERREKVEQIRDAFAADYLPRRVRTYLHSLTQHDSSKP
ncbi:Wzz/FepE/Etk N-terminal domain-containing protein [Salinibacter ruber]|uniref:Wzz/FepE/Etk N-terminal domain-containing protein n=1 Tax=Salinibacter ruber TaxID=146919 RepID=UPI0013AFE8E8|nr:Wzz/FepE/Etk N-terminal domain-containing protein [Salinibacter ruber]